MIWIFVFSLVILLSAVIATVVRKTGTNLAWGKILGWVGVIAVVITVSIVWSKKSDQGKQNIHQLGQTSLVPQYDWYWKLPNDQTVRGRNEAAPNERRVDWLVQADGSVRATLYYTAYGMRESTRLCLYRKGSGLQGTWEQDRPADHGTIDVTEVSPGFYSGTITWSDGKAGSCSFRRR